MNRFAIPYGERFIPAVTKGKPPADPSRGRDRPNVASNTKWLTRPPKPVARREEDFRTAKETLRRGDKAFHRREETFRARNALFHRRKKAFRARNEAFRRRKKTFHTRKKTFRW